MALSKVNFNSMNITPSASKAIKFNSGNNGLETGDLGGSLVLLSTQTASSSANLTFASGIDSTYKEYQFHFTDIHPATNDANFQVNFRDGSTDYDATKTTTFFRAYHTEADDATGLEYRAPNDVAQSTGAATLNIGAGNENDECTSGILHLFNPSSTTFTKHFMCDSNLYEGGNNSHRALVAGYVNVTAAVDGVQFSFSSGNIDAGIIKMYGVL